MEDLSTVESAPTDSDRLGLPQLTPDIITHILTFLSPSSPTSLKTLLDCQRVSRSFQQASRSSLIWTSHLAQWGTTIIERVTLPSYASEDDRTLYTLFTTPSPPEPESNPFAYCRLRAFIDHLTIKYFSLILSFPHGKLGPFEVVRSLGLPAMQRIDREAREEAEGEFKTTLEGGEDWLSRRYWRDEVMRSYHRGVSMRIWRGIDKGEIGGVQAHVFGVAAMAGFAHSSLDHIHEHILVLVGGIKTELEASGGYILKADEQSKESNADMSIEQMRLAKLLKVVFFKLKEIGGFKPSTEAKSLEDYFLDTAFVRSAKLSDDLSIRRVLKEMQDAIDALATSPSSSDSTDINDSTSTTVESKTLERNEALAEFLKTRGNSEELDPIKFYEAHPPTINTLLFGTVIIAVCSMLPEPFKIEFQPTKTEKLLRLIKFPKELMLDDDGKTYYVDLESQTGSLIVLESENHPDLKVFDPCESIHRLTYALTTTLSLLPPSSNNLLTSPIINPTSALYTLLSIRTFISHPWTEAEAVFRVSSNALKLISLVRREFGMDVGLVEGFLVREGLLDVGGEGWRKVEVVVEVGRREDGREVDPRRRDGEVRPRYQVGEVVTHVKEDWMGVVVGWELEFVQKTRDAVEVGPPLDFSEEVDKKQPHYLVLTPGPTKTRHAPNHYIPESLLSGTSSLEPLQNLKELSLLEPIGKYFSSFILVEEKETPQFGRSEELKKMYPDDGW